jgi:hypothetical protein
VAFDVAVERSQFDYRAKPESSRRPKVLLFEPPHGLSGDFLQQLKCGECSTWATFLGSEVMGIGEMMMDSSVGWPRHRARRTLRSLLSLTMMVTVLTALGVALPARADVAPTLTINDYGRFTGTPGFYWDVTVGGSIAGACTQPIVYAGCAVALYVKLADGSTLNEGTNYIQADPFSVDLSGGANLTMVEAFRASVSGGLGTVFTEWVPVPDPYASADFSMRVNTVTSITGGVMWDVSIGADNFYLLDGICPSLAFQSCSYDVEGKRPDGSTVWLRSGYVATDPLAIQVQGGVAGSISAIRASLGGAGGNLYSSWIPVSNWVEDGRDLATAELAFVASVSRLGAQGACTQLALYPGTHEAQSSVNDQSLACTAAVQAGMTAPQVFRALLQQFGHVIASMVNVAEVVGQPPTSTTSGVTWEWPTWPYNSPGSETEPAPARPSVAPPVLDPTWEAILTESLIKRGMITTYGFDSVPIRQHAEQVARQCIFVAVLTGIDDQRCLDTNIFVPGSDVLEASQHDWDAILAGRPALLSYRTGQERAAAGFAPRWYVSQGCEGSASATPPTACDEYPFYSSEQGGTSATASLRIINLMHNSREGLLWLGVASVCDAAPVTSTNRDILVVPIPIQGGPVSSGWCGGS